MRGQRVWPGGMCASMAWVMRGLDGLSAAGRTIRSMTWGFVGWLMVPGDTAATCGPRIGETVQPRYSQAFMAWGWVFVRDLGYAYGLGMHSPA